MVNWPSGKIILISFSWNLGIASSPLDVDVSVAVSLPLGARVFSGFSSDDSFHLKNPDWIPRPVSSSESPGCTLALLRVDTWSETSSSSKYVAIRSRATLHYCTDQSNPPCNKKKLTCMRSTKNIGRILSGSLYYILAQEADRSGNAARTVTTRTMRSTAILTFQNRNQRRKIAYRKCNGYGKFISLNHKCEEGYQQN